MYVRVCNGVTERDIDGATAAGCCSLRQLRDTRGVGNCSGRLQSQMGELSGSQARPAAVNCRRHVPASHALPHGKPANVFIHSLEVFHAFFP